MARPPQPASEPGADPSMDDILASIRRILSDEEKAAGGAPPPPAPENVLVLDSSMMLPEPAEPAAPGHEAPGQDAHRDLPGHDAPGRDASGHDAGPVAQEPPPAPARAPEPPPPAPEPAHQPAPLVAPEAAAAAASAVSELMRTLASERNVAVHRNGPTIEDLVREEMRPLLKAWLDNHLPPLVERLVRAEIERVVGRMAP